MANIITKKEAVWVFWAVKDSTGVYVYGNDGAIAEGEIQMMERARSFATFEVTQNEPELRTLLADGGIYTNFRIQPTTPVTANMAMLGLDQQLSTVAIGTSLYTEGEHSVELVANSCIDFAKLAIIVNSKATVLNTSTGIFTDKWLVEEYLDVDAFPLAASAFGDPSAETPTFNYALNFREPSTTLAGETITSGDYGRTKGYMRQYTSANPVIWGTIVGDNSTVQYTIPSDYDPVAAAATAIQLWDDGTEQDYGSSAGEFELNSSNNQLIDFATAPGSGSIHPFKLEFNGDTC